MVVPTVPERTLDDLAADIHRVWAEAKAHYVALWDGYFATGRLLLKARERFTDNQSYGRWFAAQGFGFGLEWGRRLRTLADREPEVRALAPSPTAVADGDLPGVNAVLAMLKGDTGLLPESDNAVQHEQEGFLPWDAFGGRDWSVRVTESVLTIRAALRAEDDGQWEPRPEVDDLLDTLTDELTERDALRDVGVQPRKETVA
jgi:hypothetical protein